MAGTWVRNKRDEEEGDEVEEEDLNQRVLKLVEAGEIQYTQDQLDSIKCGLGPCTPHWLQRFASKKIMVLAFVFSGLFMGMFFTYSVSVISTIEKRFKFSSKQTGILLSGNDISQVLLAIFLSYYGTFGHRPRWVGVGVLFTAASCFTASLPHFIYGPGQDAIDLAATASAPNRNSSSQKYEELCRHQPEESCGNDSGGGTYGAAALLFLAQFFVGIAISILYTIGTTYIDDNINKKVYPIYQTLMSLLRVLGPVLGFVIGGKCLSLWIEPAKAPNLSNEDPRWLGAWWMGFAFLSVILVLSGTCFFFFPKKLPATLRRETKAILRQLDKEKKAGGTRDFKHFADKAEEKKTNLIPNMKNLGKALKRLFTNKIWVGNLFNNVLTLLAISGYWSFKPKYMENQFRKSATDANYYTGISSLITSVFGACVSGSVLRWCRPGPRFVTGYVLFIDVAAVASVAILMFIGCPKLDVVGLSQGVSLPSCSGDCGCTEKYTPICSQDSSTLFYSPCVAGCTIANTSTTPIVYSNCSCISSVLSSPSPIFTDEGVGGGWATRGYCPEPCNGFFYYMLVQIIMQAIGSTGRIAGSIVHLRCVADEDKAIALGTHTVLISLLAFIPGPIIMGAIIDSACLLWDTSCGVKGNCWLYDSDKFRFILHLFPTVVMAIAMLGDVVVFKYSNQLDLYGLKESQSEMEMEEESKKGDADEMQPLKAEKPPNNDT